jgi:NAD(P)-dependent dehydrogenase (short-subunit alcohol dehydrogenase family)
MKGKTILITGGSSGIGKATARLFGQRGSSVVIASRDAQKGKEVEKELKNENIEITWIQADVTKPESVKKMVESVIDKYGRLDFAFNNAACGGEANYVENIDEAEWMKTINCILSSTLYCMKYEIQAMLKNKCGSIVNNASVDGLRGFPMDPAYSAAKHGVIGLTKSSAMQYAQKGIRINAICPGWTMTPPVERMLQNGPEGMEKRVLMHQPISRFGKPEEIASAVYWLCSDESSFVLGTAIPIDGGYTAL